MQMDTKIVRLPERLSVPMIKDVRDDLNNLISAYANPNTDNSIGRVVRKKCASYRSQDKAGRRDPSENASETDVLELLVASQLRCRYCRSGLRLTDGGYRQWTLDRIDNNESHTRDNCVISCLLCNLEKRRIAHSRFLAGKQLRVTRLD